MASSARKMDPAVSFSCGDGYADEWADTIEGGHTTIATWKGQEYADTQAPLGTTLFNELERARRLPWRAADRHDNKMKASKAMIEVAAAEAGRNAASQAGPRNGEPAARFAAQAVFVAAEKATTGVLAEKYADEASAIGEAVGSAFVAFADGFQSCWADWSGYDSLRGEFSLPDLYQETSLTNEMRGGRAPASDGLQAFFDLVNGPSPDPKKIALFMRAARVVMKEIRDMPAPRLSARYPEPGSGEAQRGDALALLAAFEDYKNQTRPRVLDESAELLGSARQLCFLIFGSSPTYATRGEFAIHKTPMTSRDVTSAKTPWIVSPSWFTRFLKPNAMRLPGWSPVGAMTNSRPGGRGVQVRLPAARDEE